MKKYLIFFLVIFFINVNTVKGIDINATSAILMDIDTNRIMYAKDIHKVRSVASISKIMTAILAIENTDIKKSVTVGDEIDKSYGSGIYIKKGEILTIEDLLYGLMLRSGNDASYVIAKNTFNNVDKFVDKMNELANKIGMKNTIFNNPNGLDEEKANYSTSYDMALLTSYAYKNEEFKKIISTNKYTLKTNMNTYIWYNKNKLLSSYKYCTGGKTGYTKIAKRTLVNTASKNNLNLVVVTLNDGNDFEDHKNLFEYGFENYEKVDLLKKGNLKINQDYYEGILYIKNDYSYPLLQSEKESIKLEYNLDKKRSVKNKDEVGRVNVYLNGEIIHVEKIYIKIEKKSFLIKLKEWFDNLW